MKSLNSKVINLFVFLGWFCVGFIFSHAGYSHGEDVTGPHGGMIRMPGDYHVEFVAEPETKTFKVYLLDLQFKNPTTAHSKVRMEWTESGKIQASTDCEAEDEYFECKIPTFKKSLNSELIIWSTRFSKTGAAAKYKLKT